MKSLKKNLVMITVMFTMVVALLMTNVNATSGGLLLNVTPTDPTPAPTTTVTPTPVPTRVATTTPTPVPTTSTDLPKTGENDIYIVSAIGLVALVIGGVAYTQSRKYNI